MSRLPHSGQARGTRSVRPQWWQTQRAVELVEDAPGAAVGAVALPAAVGAVQHRRVATAIQEDQALLAAGVAFAQGLEHGWRQRRWRLTGSARQRAHVEQPHPRQRRARDALIQRQAAVATRTGVLPAFERRRRRPEHHRHAPGGRDRRRGRAPSSARPPAACTTRSCSSSTTIRPSRGSDANTASRVPSTRSAWPRCAASQWRRRCAGVSALCMATTRRDRKALRPRGPQLRRQVDLGHQQQRLASARERTLAGLQVDLGLAAAGDAVQQQRRGVRLRAPLRRSPPPRWPARRQAGRTDGATGAARRSAWRSERLTRAASCTALEPAQLGRQHRQRDLADRALVVAGSEVDQRQPGRPQRGMASSACATGRTS